MKSLLSVVNKCKTKVIQYTPHKAIVTIATTILVVSSLQIGHINIELMDPTCYILVLQSLSSCLFIASGLYVAKIFRIFTIPPRGEKQHSATSSISFSFSKTIFCARSTECVCVYGHCAQPPAPLPFNLPPFKIPISQTNPFWTEILRQYSSLMSLSDITSLHYNLKR